MALGRHGIYFTGLTGLVFHFQKEWFSSTCAISEPRNENAFSVQCFLKTIQSIQDIQPHLSVYASCLYIYLLYRNQGHCPSTSSHICNRIIRLVVFLGLLVVNICVTETMVIAHAKIYCQTFAIWTALWGETVHSQHLLHSVNTSNIQRVQTSAKPSLMNVKQSNQDRSTTGTKSQIQIVIRYSPNV